MRSFHNPFLYLLAVAKTGSIRAAAETMHVAPSAISRYVGIFEDAAGTKLFERHVRGMTPTAAGEIYLRYARSIINEGKRVQADVEDLKGLKRGHIRLCSIEGVVSGPLANAIGMFVRAFPGVTLQLRTMGTETVMTTLRDGDADIGIAFHSSPMAGVHIARRLSDPLKAVVSPDHAFAARSSLSFIEVMQSPLALPEHSFGVRQLVDAACLAHQIRPNIVFETNSIEALRSFAREGLGVSLLPFRSAQREILTQSIVGVSVDEATLLSSTMDICTQKDRELSLAAAAFLEHMTAALGPGATAPGL